MKTARRWILVVGIVLTAWLAYVARDAVHEFIIVPVAYGVWQIRALLLGVAQLLQWGLLVVAMTLIMVWQLIPRLSRHEPARPRTHFRDGPVDSTALALLRARGSNYFRWQLAHRLGRVATYLENASGGNSLPESRPLAVARYLDAGLSRSFVDYASPRRLFGRPKPGDLDLDSQEVVHHLETRLSVGGGTNDKSR